MVGDSAGLRQEADAAKQAFASLSQKASALQSKFEMAGEDQKSFIEGQIEALKGSITNAAADVNRTSSDYASALTQERTDELMKEIKEDEERIIKEEKESKEKEELEREIHAKKTQEKPEVSNDDLLFLSEAFGTAAHDTVSFSNSSAGAEKAVDKNTDKPDSKKEPVQKTVGGTTATNA